MVLTRSAEPVLLVTVASRAAGHGAISSRVRPVLSCHFELLGEGLHLLTAVEEAPMLVALPGGQPRGHQAPGGMQLRRPMSLGC
jgi:hypothetical protein